MEITLATEFPDLPPYTIQMITKLYPTLSEARSVCQSTVSTQNQLPVDLPDTLNQVKIAPTDDLINDLIVIGLKSEAQSGYPDALKTLQLLVGNVFKNPEEEKFRRIRTENKKFQQSIGRYPVTVQIFLALGYSIVIEYERGHPEEVMYLFDIDLEVIAKSLNIIREELSTHSLPQQEDNSEWQGSWNVRMPAPPENEYKQMRDDRTSGQRPKEMRISDLANMRPSDTYDPSIVTGSYTSTPGFDRQIGLRCLELTNEFRRSQGLLQELIWHDGICDVCMEHSVNMAHFRVKVGHDGFSERARKVPMSFIRSCAENVAFNKGAYDIALVSVNGWINSPGHRKNLLGGFNYCAIGVAQSADGGFYLTQIFASGIN